MQKTRKNKKKIFADCSFYKQALKEYSFNGKKKKKWGVMTCKRNKIEEKMS